jgi:hypothetical protein
MQSSNGELPSDGKQLVQKPKYTGERLLRDRPRVYRKVVELLAAGTGYREICRECGVADDTVKAVERREAVPIAARKERLMSVFANVAEVSAERMEQLASKANLRDAGITAGIATEKMLLLHGEPTMHVQHSVQVSGNAIYEQLNALAQRLNQSQPKTATVIEVTPQAALPGSDASCSC